MADQRATVHGDARAGVCLTRCPAGRPLRSTTAPAPLKVIATGLPGTITAISVSEVPSSFCCSVECRPCSRQGGSSVPDAASRLPFSPILLAALPETSDSSRSGKTPRAPMKAGKRRVLTLATGGPSCCRHAVPVDSRRNRRRCRDGAALDEALLAAMITSRAVARPVGRWRRAHGRLDQPCRHAPLGLPFADEERWRAGAGGRPRPQGRQPLRRHGRMSSPSPAGPSCNACWPTSSMRAADNQQVGAHCRAISASASWRRTTTQVLATDGAVCWMSSSRQQSGADNVVGQRLQLVA